jgi:hypothetical protein
MSLEGRMIAISIGDAPDRGRLGYPQREVDRVLLSVCTALVRAGARIVYGGNLDPAGFTFKIFRHLSEAYAVRRSTPRSCTSCRSPCCGGRISQTSPQC